MHVICYLLVVIIKQMDYCHGLFFLLVFMIFNFPQAKLCHNALDQIMQWWWCYFCCFISSVLCKLDAKKRRGMGSQIILEAEEFQARRTSWIKELERPLRWKILCASGQRWLPSSYTPAALMSSSGPAPARASTLLPGFRPCAWWPGASLTDWLDGLSMIDLAWVQRPYLPWLWATTRGHLRRDPGLTAELGPGWVPPAPRTRVVGFYHGAARLFSLLSVVGPFLFAYVKFWVRCNSFVMNE